MQRFCVRQSLTVLLVLAACTLVACGSRPRGPIPVEDRVAGQSASRTPPKHAAQASQAGAAASTSPVAVSTPISMHGSSNPSDNAGKPGYYSVRPGDTLTKIALDNGQAWRDIARWNKLDNPNVIEVDQVLRVAPPATEVSAVRAPSSSTARPAAAQPALTNPPANLPSVAATTSSPPPAASSTAPASTAVNPDDALVFAWPHPGTLLASFDESKNKGLDLGGNAGDPVLASADGKVVYAGSGLRGYGNLVILKHNNTYLTAYAHNQSLLVKEDQTVTKGQRIAEMGNSDADRVKLHFEIRKLGKPVDPAKFLPARP